ncbi:hypothetical protein K788_0009141 [Paraburkholderia caribensis MBA4]|uniref:Uncharacterized protein n=1 Tax=Paraburkholderia caribensis MBA4 TaxID=1323664 RepID=A0A0P0RJF8_9BURK|nr:hypothetical protein K788_0009141 [Paraburkholderia caribensis MBA4]
MRLSSSSDFGMRKSTTSSASALLFLIVFHNPSSEWLHSVLFG